MNNKTLYRLAKDYAEADVANVFSEHDLICIVAEDKTPYYVSQVDTAFAAYRGEKGLTGYLALSLCDDDTDSLEYIEAEQEQECLLCLFGNRKDDLDELDLKAVADSGVEFAEGNYPQFRNKLQYHFPWYIDEKDAAALSTILRALIYAKEYFCAYKKTSKTNSFSFWLDALNLEERESKEYIPCIEIDGDTFKVTARVLEDESFGYSFPQAFFTDEEKRAQYKRMKAKSGKIMAVATGMFPEPLMGEKSGRPVFPIYQLIYDPQTHIVLDIFIIENYESEHGTFVSRMLQVFEQVGKPQAIHCYGKRTLPLLEKLGPQMGIMVVDGGKSEEINAIVIDMLNDLYGEHDEHDHHHHHHEHGEMCGCGHDHESCEDCDCGHDHHDHDHHHEE